MLKINNTTFNTTMQDVLTELRRELAKNGSQLLQREPKLLNGYLMVCCPFHKNGLEKKPSAQFRIEDGLFWCFTCQQAHSLTAVIEYCLHTNGWQWLRDHFEFETTTTRNLSIDFTKPEVKPKSYVDPKELEKYRFIHPYMYERKLTLDIIRKFDIGFDQETNCITFPVKDIHGNILFIARRAVDRKWFNYPLGAEKPLYGEYELRRELSHGKQINEVYVMESMLDALVAWSWGKYAIALNGLGSKTQYELLKQLPVRTLILATDNDPQGSNARLKIKANVKNKFIKEISYESYGTCKDINDMTKEQFLNCKISL